MTPHHTRVASAPSNAPAGLGSAVWTLIIPVKDTGLAKTRLTPFSQPDRAALALAFVLDAASAALRCPSVRRVVAVTNDRAVGRALSGIGVDVLADEPAAGLNPAVAFGMRTVRAHDSGARVAVMCGDLPALQAGDLSEVFLLASALPCWVVADAAGVGTTMLGGTARTDLRPAFGPASRARHLDLGAVDLAAGAPGGALSGLRRDVDTLDDLSQARLLGLGSYTRAALVDIDAA